MEQLQFYKTIFKSNIYVSEKIKGSKFITLINHIESKKEAEDFLLSVKKKYFDATHHCYAYKLKTDGQTTVKFSDDGEPSNTAGKPILTVIEHSEIINIIVIVVRYFGGTKLGTGGLIKAYTDSAKDGLTDCEVVQVEITEKFKININYNLIKTIKHILIPYKAEIVAENYSDIAEMEISVNASLFDKLKKELFDKTNGNIIFLY